MSIFNYKQREQELIRDYENRLEEQKNGLEQLLKEVREEKEQTEADSDMKSVLLWGLCETVGRYGDPELRRLAERIMFLCALQFQENEVSEESFNVLELLDGLVKEHREEADARGITLRGVVKSIRDTKAILKKDGLGEVLRILLSEALRAADEGDSILLSCEQVEPASGEEVAYCFSVLDTASEVMDGPKEPYFEPFGEVRGPQRPADRVELPILERLCRLIGADLHAENGEESGMIFSVVIGGKKA